MTRVPKVVGELRAAHRELAAIVATVDAGGWVEAGRLTWPTVLADAGLIAIGEHGAVTPTAMGRRLAAIPVRP